ncbi:FeoA family protein [Paratractidigestivibacter sp.]|uniref:FeoA family protein n=1 Tax=Paratractidigestivibacter sp. TaxID=2847316 RepID=UPI002ABE427C|nr:FeoA family protein [Paratractidigestivibacter sp.]
MSDEAIMSGVAANAGAPVSMAGALPLAMLGEDECAKVVKIKGGAELKKHLTDLGLVEGAEVTVISRVSGDVIVNVKGARLALNRTMSSHVMVSL